MPIYEYGCKACDHEFETIQRLSEAPLVDCPACGEAALRKKVSAAAFRLKGGGWYETDFKGGGKKNLHGEQGAAGDKDKASSTDAAKGDAKPSAANGKSAGAEASKPAKSAASAD